MTGPLMNGAGSPLRDAVRSAPNTEQLSGKLNSDFTQHLDDLQSAPTEVVKVFYDLSAHRRAWIVSRCWVS